MTTRKKTNGEEPATIEDVLKKIESLRKVGSSDRKLLSAALLEFRTATTDSFKRAYEQLDKFFKAIDAHGDLLREHAKELTDHHGQLTDHHGKITDLTERVIKLESPDGQK